MGPNGFKKVFRSKRFSAKQFWVQNILPSKNILGPKKFKIFAKSWKSAIGPKMAKGVWKVFNPLVKHIKKIDKEGGKKLKQDYIFKSTPRLVINYARTPSYKEE